MNNPDKERARSSLRLISSMRLVTVLCTVFALAGVGFFIHGLVQFNSAQRSMTWPTVPGTVTRSNYDGADGLRVIYEYEVDGRTYQGSNIGFGEREVVFSANYWRRLQREYARGKAVDVHYDPADPAVSALEPGVRPGTYTEPVFGPTFALLAIGFWWLHRRMTRRTVSTP